jgi:hypothetical protein
MKMGGGSRYRHYTFISFPLCKEGIIIGVKSHYVDQKKNWIASQ